MSISLIILFAVAVVLLIVVIAASRLSNHYSITESIAINRPVSSVFDYIKLLRHSDKYNKWTMLDPNVKRSYMGTDGTVGFIAAWDSAMKQVGTGEQEIIAIFEDQRVDWALRFEKPFRNEASSYMTTAAMPGETTLVTWAFEGRRNLSMKIFHLLFNLPKMLGRDLAESLRNLKRVLEK